MKKPHAWFKVALPLSSRGWFGRTVDCISVLGDWGGFSGMRPPLDIVVWGFLGGGGGGTTGFCTITIFGAGELFPKERTEVNNEVNSKTALIHDKDTQSYVVLLSRWLINKMRNALPLSHSGMRDMFPCTPTIAFIRCFTYQHIPTLPMKSAFHCTKSFNS